jgi:hypothetical protein
MKVLPSGVVKMAKLAIDDVHTRAFISHTYGVTTKFDNRPHNITFTNLLTAKEVRGRVVILIILA